VACVLLAIVVGCDCAPNPYASLSAYQAPIGGGAAPSQNTSISWMVKRREITKSRKTAPPSQIMPQNISEKSNLPQFFHRLMEYDADSKI
jgi:hypothetical protein